MQSEKQQNFILAIVAVVTYTFYFFLRETENLIVNRVFEKLAEIKMSNPGTEALIVEVREILKIVQKDITILYWLLLILFLIVVYRFKANKILKGVLVVFALTLGFWVKFAIQ